MSLRTKSGILSEIVTQKRAELSTLREHASEWERRAYATRDDRRPFEQALLQKEPAIIAEVKKASPSKGLLQPDFHPAAIAKAYEAGGAACLSVLTDRQFFQGTLGDLQTARNAIRLPVLRKDFTIDRIQIWEAAAHQADAILLIAAILTETELRSFREAAAELHLAALVEVHGEEELQKAIASGAGIIGVNNRNLNTFEVTLETSLRLSEKIPAATLRVSESGIFQRSDIDLLRGAGFRAFLVGESLMKAADPTAALQALLS